MRPPGYETLDRTGAGWPYESMGPSRRAADTTPDGVAMRPNASYPGTFTTPDGVLHRHGALPATACTCAFTQAALAARAVRRASPAQAGPADADLELRLRRLRLIQLSA